MNFKIQPRCNYLDSLRLRIHSRFACSLLLICTDIFPSADSRSRKQRGRALWGNISSVPARTIIASGVEATARSHHNVDITTVTRPPSFPSNSRDWTSSLSHARVDGSQMNGRWKTIVQHPCRQNNEIRRKQCDICIGYWVRLRVVYTRRSAEAFVDASDANWLTLTLLRILFEPTLITNCGSFHWNISRWCASPYSNKSLFL